ncbi:MAG: PKD domain-containing protein [Methanobacteriota archaeon]
MTFPAAYGHNAPSSDPANEPPQILGLGFGPGIAGVASGVSAGVSDDQPNRLVTYTFYFGDGLSESGAARPGDDIWTSHPYASEGSYRLVFEVTDSQGATGAAAMDVFVAEADILRVVTSVDIHPDRGVPGRIRVSDRLSGSDRDTWGLTWMKTWLSGVYPSWGLAFSDVPGLGTPPAQRYPSCGGSVPRVFECSGVYTAHGWLRVITDPPVPGTIYVDGVPRNDWGMWTDLPPGTYTVSFGPVAGMRPPAPQTVLVRAEEMATVIGNYARDETAPGPDPSSFGMLRVVTQLESGQRGIPTQIEIDGIPRDTWGLTWVKLAPGCYEISFSDVPGLGTPVPTPACVSAGQTREVTGIFDVLGWLRVSLNPPLPATISVGWIPFNDWGVWTDVAPGTYVIAFGHSDGYRAPPAQTVTVRAGETTSVVGEYVSVP